MKVSLVLTNSSGKTEYIVTDNMNLLSLTEAITSIKRLENIVVVNGRFGPYLRSIRNNFRDDNLDAISITINQFFKAYTSLDYREKKPGLIGFEKVRNQRQAHASRDIIYVNEWDKKKMDYTDLIPTKSRESVIRFLQKHKDEILKSATKQDIDPYSLGAILIDEYCRTGWEDILDTLAAQVLPFRRVSIGLAQIQLKTAKSIIKSGLYSPDPAIDLTKNKFKLIHYLDDDTHAINFSAGYIRLIINDWSKYIDLSSRPDIIGSVYSQGYNKSHANPIANKRGLQIKNEFYPLAEKILK